MDNREKLHKLFDAVLDANGLGARTREETGMAPTVFFEFNGHIAECEIRVYDNGWHREADEWKEFRIKTDDCIANAKVDEICGFLKMVALPKTKENALVQMIQTKEDAINKEMRELEELRGELKELQGGEANEH